MLVVVAVITAACGGGGATRNDGPGKVGSAFDGITTTTGGGEAVDTTVAEGQAAPEKPATRGAPTSGRPTRTTGAPGTTGAPPGGHAGPPAAPQAGDAALEGADGPPGAFARTVLRPEPATTVVFERMQQQGAEPRAASVDHATSVLRSVTGKAVESPAPIAVPGEARDWSGDAIRGTAARLTKAEGRGRAVLHVLFLRGTFNGSRQVLGVAVEGDVLAVFSDSVAAAATPVVSAATLEDAVLMHELGHLLGLVDLARNTGRADPEHPGHSKNRGSVMYWAVESSLVTQVLQGGPPRDFDRDDLADLRALREGA